MRALASLLVAAALFAAGGPSAHARSANRDLARAKKLMEQFKDRAALRALKRARKRRGNSPAIRAEIEVYMGVAYFNLLKQAKAAAAFKRALGHDRAVSLPSSVSPKIRALFDKTKAELAPQPKTPPKTGTGSGTGTGTTGTGTGSGTGTGTSGTGRSGDPPDDRDGSAVQHGQPLTDTGAGASGINWPAWISAGVAVGALGAAVGMAWTAKTASNDASDLEVPYEQAEVNHAKAKDRALVANVLFGVAGAAAVTSAIFFIMRGLRSDRTTAARDGDDGATRLSAGVSPTRGGLVVGVGGRLW